MDKKKADEKLRDECLKYFKEHLVFARLLKDSVKNISLTADLRGR